MYQGDQSNLETQPPEESSNRTFLIAAGLLGGIVLLSLACLAAVYFFGILPGRNTANQQAAAQATQAAQVQQALTETSQAASLATPTALPTDTPVLAEATSTATPAGTDTPNPATATVGAALTQAAIAQLTVVPTSTALPKTGIADQYGAPGLVIMGMVLIAVIFLARRLRAAPTK
jgi:cytoskeletal protein RodZ